MHVHHGDRAFLERVAWGEMEDGRLKKARRETSVAYARTSPVFSLPVFRLPLQVPQDSDFLALRDIDGLGRAGA